MSSLAETAGKRTMRLHTITLGCQMSAADGAEMSGPLYKRGFSAADSPQNAYAILINTCTVRQHAEDRAVSLIGSLKPWKNEDPNRVLIVTGCAAERLGEWIRKKFPHVDLIVGAKSIEQFPEIVEETLNRRFDALSENREAFGACPGADAGLDKELFSSPVLGATAPGAPVADFVTIMRGCNYSCSYCIVPLVRGREHYRPVEDILEEARRKTAAGVKEITLLGQTVNSYSSTREGRKINFSGLLELVDQTPRLQRLRFMSPHPYYVDDRMIGAIARLRTVCELLHLPVQSGSDRLLKLMRRNYTRDSYLQKVEKIRRAIAGVAISTDFIVGFPSETEEEFAQTLSLVEILRPVCAYCFKYSPRESTESAAWPDDVPVRVKEERLERLNKLVDSMTATALQEQIGKTLEVLSEQSNFGRTRDGFKVKWNAPAPIGERLPVKITAAAPRILLGETADEI